MKTKKIMVLSNEPNSTYNFRKELLKSLIDKKYEVYLTMPYGERVEDFKEMGVKFVETNLNRRGTNPFSDLKLYKQYKRILKSIKPDIVLTYTIKPNIYGGLAARRLKIPYIANITGLGTAVENKGILQKVTTFLYKRAFKNIDVVFFQNNENKKFFEKNKLSKGKHILLPGSGVNLNEFEPLSYPNNEKIVITYIGRIMSNKGIRELLQSIKIIHEKELNIEFRIIGTYDDLELKDLVDKYHDKGYLKYLGYQSDIKKYLEETNVLINPTYHEGMSNVLLEASASCRPVLASNVPGCKEIFDEGITGYGFEPRNVDAIIDVIEKFINLTQEEMEEMGKKARMKIEKEFDRTIVVNSYMSEINKIIKEINK